MESLTATELFLLVLGVISFKLVLFFSLFLIMSTREGKILFQSLFNLKCGTNVNVT